MRLLLLLLTVAALGAADRAAATWTAGEGRRGGTAATAGASIAFGERCAAGPGGATLALAGFATGELRLGADAAVVLATEAVDDGEELVVQLEAGEVTVDVDGTGPYRRLRARGAALEVEVTGTLFTVRRDPRGQDTVALVRGAVQVRLRREIAAALGREGVVALAAGQAVSGSANGLGAPVATAAPTAPATALAKPPEVDVRAVSQAIAGAQIRDGLRVAGQAGTEVTDTASGAGTLGAPPPPP